MPEVLDADGRAQWQHLSGQFRTLPTRVREGDRSALTAFCAWWSAWLVAARDVKDRGPVVEGRSEHDRGRLVKNPATLAMREASTQHRYWARELGLTPDGRARMGLKDAPDGSFDDDDPLA